jgi:chaperonin cofactor prefoldin
VEQERLNLNDELSRLRSIQSEYEKVKNQVNHIETFRNELNKAREEIRAMQDVHSNEINLIKSSYEKTIAELNEKIEYLQLTPAKRKKIDEQKALQDSKKETNTNVEAIVKDGGSF